jgi:hypothetical protein
MNKAEREKLQLKCKTILEAAKRGDGWAWREGINWLRESISADSLLALLDHIDALERQVELRKPHISEDETGELCFEFWGEGTKKITLYTRPTDLFKSCGPLDEMPDIPKTGQEVQKGFEWLYEAAIASASEVPE